MNKSIPAVSKNLHLIISAIIVIIVGLVYGIAPGNVLPKLFDITITTTDLQHVFRTMMGLYIAMALFWIMGTVQSRHWKTATITNIIFFGGLAAGRLISMLADGIPSRYFVIGFFAEIILTSWGIANIKKYKS